MDALRIYRLLFDAYGPQHWWPAESAFEMMIGAILTQNTAWTNVEKAIANLKAADALDARAVLGMGEERLRELIRPSGYFNQKAARLRCFCAFYLDHGGETGLKQLQNPRAKLLALHGIGPETADSMLLYALDMPVFVIDAYTRRIFARLGLTAADASYHELQAFFHAQLPMDPSLFNEFHALIVYHAKEHCLARPLCDDCPLQACCACFLCPSA
jgi:endonuclease III related protein